MEKKKKIVFILVEPLDFGFYVTFIIIICVNRMGSLFIYACYLIIGISHHTQLLYQQRTKREFQCHTGRPKDKIIT